LVDGNVTAARKSRGGSAFISAALPAFVVWLGMRQIIVLSFLVLVLGVLAAKMVDRSARTQGAAHPGAAAVAVAPTAPRTVVPASYDGNTFVISPDARGHFLVDARIDTRRIELMVDTGASLVTLRESDAAALGIHPFPRDYTLQSQTANGIVRAAPTMLSMVEVGGLMVRDVQAAVLPDKGLGQNLLGLSFLRRLRRFEYADGRLMLEQ
jgi:aspartyl protease family protein